MTHQFQKSKKIGDKAEQTIFEFFSPNWEITRASVPLQKIGIDFLFKHKETGESYSIELKTDHRADQTGNVFIETESTENQKGWAYTCKADLIFYYLPERSLIYSISPTKLRSLLPRWSRRYPTRAIPNQGRFEKYTTRGLLVSLDEFERHATVINM